ncbi:cupin domain-containing protein [Bradyrhizobium sp. Pha-3]|uniref:cupin domain-containing protein n=1 Tax=Bradyrhizobium sp. Pha-3 TaxID=208375 RepID=UPI0035D4741C
MAPTGCRGGIRNFPFRALYVYARWCATIVLEAGDSIYFFPKTKGEWNIIKTVRKAYVILPKTT